MRNEIEKTGASLGISEKLLGHRYICSAVEMALDDAAITSSIVARLYPEVALKHGKTTASVERAMRYAIFTSWNKRNRIIMSKFEKKPDNLHLIMYVINAVNAEQV